MDSELGPIHSYAIFYFAGILLHFILAVVFARRLRVRIAVALCIGVSYTLSMTTGARVLYDVTHGIEFGAADLVSNAYYERGGLWGGPFLHLTIATGTICAFVRRRGAAFDVVALTLPLPMAFAKVGCFLHGCCYGTPTSHWVGIRFPENAGGAPTHISIHPTQLYEIAVLVGAFVFMLALRNPRWHGLRLLWFLVLYGTGRALIEFVRGDATLAIGHLTISQRLCFGAAIVAAAILVYRHKRTSTPEAPTISKPVTPDE